MKYMKGIIVVFHVRISEKSLGANLGFFASEESFFLS